MSGSLFHLLLAGATAGDEERDYARELSVDTVVDVAGSLAGAQIREKRPSVSGTLRGVHVELDQAFGRTRVSASMAPLAAPLRIDLRADTPPESALVETGKARDDQLGDPEFDGAYIVERAPSDIATRLLDEAARRSLLELRPTHVGVFGEGVILEWPDWQPAETAVKALDLAATLVTRIPAAIAEADARAAAAGATPFRGVADAGPERALNEARAHEVAELEELQKRRR